MHVNGGFGSQAGCNIQLPKFTAERHQQRDRGELRWGLARGHLKAVKLSV